MDITARTILLVIAVLLFALTGFGLVDGSEHFVLVPLGLAAFAAASLVNDRR